MIKILKLFFLLSITACLYGKSILIDNETGLEWQDSKDTKLLKKDFVNAKNYCTTLNLDEKSDWRLPSLSEIETIIGDSNIKDKFTNRSDDIYWTSTNSEIYPKNIAYTAYMKYSFSGLTMPKTATLNIRCVRGKISKANKKLLASAKD